MCPLDPSRSLISRSGIKSDRRFIQPAFLTGHDDDVLTDSSKFDMTLQSANCL